MAYSESSSFALVLSGGGARGAYQAGVLSAIAERIGAETYFPVITGVSAGAINAVSLASHTGSLVEACAALRRGWLSLSPPKVFKADFVSLTGTLLKWLWMLLSGGITPGFQVRGILETEPLRGYLDRVIDPSGIEANLRAGRLRALALSATSYTTGQTITFVHGLPGVPTWERAGRRAVLTKIGLEHVMASSALPLIFPAIQIGDDYYGDGSIRQGAPLAPSIHLGADRLLAISVRYPRSTAEAAEPQMEGYPPPAQVLGMLMNAIFLDALETDSERLERINRTLALLPTGAVPPDLLRPIQLLVVRPSKDLGKLAADFAGQLPRALRILSRGLGAHQSKAPDFLSYLLFERPYIRCLIQLGYSDGAAQWDRIGPFLEPESLKS
ncbi:patatin-like phospholipase family protein [Acidobacteria bacterium AH-259-O06]|nr:patatin-like phospholipase family protein [Acidobacteria bacterium AH-259-O06]